MRAASLKAGAAAAAAATAGAKKHESEERSITLRKNFAGAVLTMHNNQRVVSPDEERIDALLQHIASLDVPSVRYMSGLFVPDFDTTVTVADGITARVSEKKEAEGVLMNMTIVLTSTRRTVGGIRQFLEECFHNYRALINNKVCRRSARCLVNSRRDPP